MFTSAFLALKTSFRLVSDFGICVQTKVRTRIWSGFVDFCEQHQIESSIDLLKQEPKSTDK